MDPTTFQFWADLGMWMESKIIPWTLGLLVSLLLGHYATDKFLFKLRKYAGCDDKAMNSFFKKNDPDTLKFKSVPPTITGVLERLFFTFIVAFNVSGAAIGMMGWLAVKMVTNLNRGDLPPHPIVRMRALTGLMGSLVSLLFSLFGGLICWLKIPLS